MKLKMFFSILIVLLLTILGYFFIGKAPKTTKITWGVVFSQKHSQKLGLPRTFSALNAEGVEIAEGGAEKVRGLDYWRENYLAILDDLKVKDIKLITHWDLIEKNPDQFDFEDLDWQISQAQKREAKILLVVGLKTGRWPECHIPNWANELEIEDLKERVLNLVQKIVSRYKDSAVIFAWQVENEPFFPFGECPKIDQDFVKKEISLVKSLDLPANTSSESRPIVVTDSGEGSFWFRVASLADIPGTTIYKKVWVKEFKFYFTHFYPPVFYWRKAQIIKRLFDKEIICTELQAEPWGPDSLYNLSLKEQEKTMDLGQYQKNIEFAKETGLKRFYLWGSEWWYWLKETQGNSSIWEEAKKLWK